MSKRTLSCYEVAWNMNKVGSTMDQIVVVVNRDRSTVYRWFERIRLSGIRKFLKDKATAKIRRPKAKTPEYVIQKIVDIRNEFGWCGQKIKKELIEMHGISIGLSTIYRYLHARFTKAAVGVKRYNKHQAMVTADRPREVVENDTVDLGGGVYAYTAIDIFTKEPSILMASNLEMATGATAHQFHDNYYGSVITHQSDGGSEFQKLYKEAVLASGAKHRYSRPYKKNEQSHIENFNKSLRSECFPRGEYNQTNIPKLQQQANEYTKHYIHRRWHMGLPKTMTPAQFQDYYKQNPKRATLELAKVTEKSRLL